MTIEPMYFNTSGKFLASNQLQYLLVQADNIDNKSKLGAFDFFLKV